MVKKLLLLTLFAGVSSGTMSQTIDDYHRFFTPKPLTLNKIKREVDAFDTFFGTGLMHDSATLSKVLCVNWSNDVKNYYNEKVIEFNDISKILSTEQKSNRYLIENETILKETKVWRIAGLSAWGAGYAGLVIGGVWMFEEAVNGGTGAYKPLLISSLVLITLGLPGKLISMGAETKRDENVLRSIYEYNGVQIINHYERNEQDAPGDSLGN